MEKEAERWLEGCLLWVVWLLEDTCRVSLLYWSDFISRCNALFFAVSWYSSTSIHQDFGVAV